MHCHRFDKLTLAIATAFALTGAVSSASPDMPDWPHGHDALRTAMASLRARGAVVVKNCNDSGPGSLRQALLDATDGAYLDLTQLTCSTISLTTGELTTPASGNVLLLGPTAYAGGPILPGFTIDAAGKSRIINSTTSGMLALKGIDVENGRATTKGGCLSAQGDVVVVASKVSGCTAIAQPGEAALGGGIWTEGSVFAQFSTVIGNTAQAATGGYAYGGGIFARAGVDIGASTILQNEATGNYGYGGGIAATGGFNVQNSLVAENVAAHYAGLAIFGAPDIGPGDVRIINSTILRNAATLTIGGVGSNADLIVSNSTIALNDTPFAGQPSGIVMVGSHTLQLTSSIVFGNYGVDIGGVTTVNGDHNLVSTTLKSLPPDTINANPMLGPLALNGGVVPTVSLQAGSPAIDTGSNPRQLGCDGRGFVYNGDPTDIRVYSRSVGPAPDIGAYETNAEDVLFASGFERSQECNFDG